MKIIEFWFKGSNVLYYRFSVFSNRFLGVLLSSISYFCLVIIIVKCYFDINYLYVAIEYGIYGKMLGLIFKKYKNVLTRLINIKLIKIVAISEKNMQ